MYTASQNYEGRQVFSNTSNVVWTHYKKDKLDSVYAVQSYKTLINTLENMDEHYDTTQQETPLQK